MHLHTKLITNKCHVFLIAEPNSPRTTWISVSTHVEALAVHCVKSMSNVPKKDWNIDVGVVYCIAPSGTQTWQWKIHYLQVTFVLKPPFLVDFQLPRLLKPEGKNVNCYPLVNVYITMENHHV